MYGSTTDSVAATATAASIALPPAWRASSPACVARGWFEATAPRRPMISGRWERGPSYAISRRSDGDRPAAGVGCAPVLDVHDGVVELLRQLAGAAASDDQTLALVGELPDRGDDGGR